MSYMRVYKVNKIKVLLNRKKAIRFTTLALGFIISAGTFALCYESDNDKVVDPGNSILAGAMLDFYNDSIIKIFNNDTVQSNKNSYDIKNLYVGAVYYEETDSKEIYIFKSTDKSGSFYTEYMDSFKAWYNLHKMSDVHRYACCKYEHIYEGDLVPLSDYLADNQLNIISYNNGMISASDIDILLGKIRKQYHVDENKKLSLVR